MRRSLLQVIACPSCRSALSLEPRREAGGWVESGDLRCASCGAAYPVADGVPILLADPRRHSRERASFTFQWELRFGRRAEPGQMLWGKDHSALPYKVRGDKSWYLDCGCGGGDIIREVALNNPGLRAVGFDLSDSIRRASLRDRAVENLDYVQGDVLSPPFRPGAFQFILSLGVLHHTADTRRALENAVEMLDRRGALSVWLYPSLEDLRAAGAAGEYRKWRRYYFIRDVLFLKRSHRLGLPLLLALCKLVSLHVSPFFHLLDHAVEGFRLRHASNTFILFDNLAPRFQHRHSRQEVLGWLRECGIKRVLHSVERGGLYTALKP